jgi:hypothetical protein
MTIKEMTTEQLKDALINGQRYLLRISQVQQELQAIEQELADREAKDKAAKEQKKK